MPAPIAVQLYSARESMAEDFEGTVRRIADMGYIGVEAIRAFPGVSIEEASRLFKSLDLTVPSAHLPLPLGDDKNEVLDIMATLGAAHMVSPGVARGTYDTIAGIEAICEKFNESSAVANANGYTFSIHNHWMEFGEVEGRNAFDVLLENLDESVFFQVDTYWTKVAGIDPIGVVKKLGKRAPLLHIKDGSTKREDAMVAVGDGAMDIAGLIDAAGDNVQWLIVELDRCDTDMLTAIAKSYTFLTESGFARGKKG